MTTRSSACHVGVSIPQISDPGRAPNADSEEKLVIVYLALQLCNLACERTKFRGRSGD
jgi:hypothetical protein